MSTGTEDMYDVVIVGGGIVGSALACALASSPALRHSRIALLEQGGAPQMQDVIQRDEPDLRVYAITPETARLLDRIGVWQHVLAARATPFVHMQVWDSQGLGYIRFDSSDAGSMELGHIVEHSVLQAALFARMETLQGRSGLDVRQRVRVERIHLPDAEAQDAAGGSWPLCALEGGAKYRARLLVGADGAASAVRAASGIGVWGWDYEQRGLVATVRTAEPNHTAWQRFLPSGPLALLPLHSHYSSIVWSTSPQLAERLKALSADDFVAELNAALSGPPLRQREPDLPPPLRSLASLAAWAADTATLAAGSASTPFVVPPNVAKLCGARVAFPLRLQHAQSYYRARVALVGDAAHSVHPLAGQGLNLGFLDVASLAQRLTQAAETGQDLGDSVVLEQYEQDRRGSNTAMQLSFDGLNRLFGADAGPAAWARNTGMALLHALPFAKSVISRFAMQGKL